MTRPGPPSRPSSPSQPNSLSTPTRTRTWRPARRGSTPWSPSPRRAAVLRPTPWRSSSWTAPASMAGDEDPLGPAGHSGGDRRAARRRARSRSIAGDHRAQQVYPDAGTARADGRTRAEAMQRVGLLRAGRRHRDRRLAARGPTAARRPAPRRRAPRDPAHRRPERRGRAGVHPGRAELRRRVHLRLPRRRHRLAGRRAAHASRPRCSARSTSSPGPETWPPTSGHMTGAAMDKNVADVWLRLWTPQGAVVRFVKQVAPAVEDLTGPPGRRGPAARALPARVPGAPRAATTTCAWTWCPRRSGRRCWRRGSSVVRGDGFGTTSWPRRTCRRVDRRRGALHAIDPRVAHYTGPGRAGGRHRGRPGGTRGGRRAAAPRSASARRCGWRPSRATTTRRGCWVVSSRCST